MEQYTPVPHHLHLSSTQEFLHYYIVPLFISFKKILKQNLPGDVEDHPLAHSEINCKPIDGTTITIRSVKQKELLY